MTSWSGWEAAFLAAASLPDTANNRKFLGDWQTHSNTDCTNNPIDLSRTMPGSTNCGSLPGGTRHAQHYTTHAQAAKAFDEELRSGNFPHLLAALLSGNPYTVSVPNDVAIDISRWGSGIFEVIYHGETGAPEGGGGGPVILKAPQALAGWHDLRKTFNNKLPTVLGEVEKMNRRSLQVLASIRRVR